jgi:hypothetical protein
MRKCNRLSRKFLENNVLSDSFLYNKHMAEEEIRLEQMRGAFRQPFELAERVIRGNYPEEELRAREGSGVILDLNEDLTDEEKEFGLSQIKKLLGSEIESAPIRGKYKSPDGLTDVSIFDVKLGEDWYISKWQNKGEKPSFIFWPEEVYEWQVENGYQQIENQQ